MSENPDRERDIALELIGRIYDAIFQPALWNDVVAGVVRYVGGTRGILFTSLKSPAEGGFQFPHGLPESFMQRWNDKYIEHDLWSRNALRLGVDREGVTVLDHELASEAELHESIAYREMLAPLGIGRLCTGIVFGAAASGVPATICSVFRNLNDEPFGEEERDRMQVLVPHLSRALGVMFRLRDAELRTAATLAALNRLASGVVLVDTRGHVSFANAAAREIFGQADGLTLQSYGAGIDRLTADNSRVSAAIDEAIGRCLAIDALHVAHFSKGMSVERPSGKRSYLLQLAPLPARNDFSARADAAAIVFVTDPEAQSTLDPALLKQLYRLTPAETRLAELLFSGATVAEASARCAISAYTARTHLKRIFNKVGVARQPELIRVLAALASTTAR